MILLGSVLLRILSTIPTFLASSEKIVWVKVKSANIRAGPSPRNKIIVRTKRNDKLLVVKEKTKLDKIKIPDGKVGWIYGPLSLSEKLKWHKGTKPLTESITQEECPSSYKKARHRELVD